MFTKSLLDFPQFVAANSQANTEGWAEAASLEVVAMSDAAKAILSQVVLEVTGDEAAAEKAAKFGLVTRSELSTAAHNGDSAVIYQDDELTQIVKAMADKLGNPAFEAVLLSSSSVSLRATRQLSGTSGRSKVTKRTEKS